MVQAIPEGVGNIVPYLSIRGATKAIKFYQAAFGAESKPEKKSKKKGKRG